MRHENPADRDQVVALLVLAHWFGVTMSLAAPVPFALVYVPWALHRVRLAHARRARKVAREADPRHRAWVAATRALDPTIHTECDRPIFGHPPRNCPAPHVHH